MNRTSLVRRMLGVGSSLLGPLALRQQRRRNAGAVFLYHRVSPDADAAYPPLTLEEFEANCVFLRRHYTVLPLAELVSRMSTGRPLGGCCAITFDDGYRDFVEHALPLLCRYQLPVTHFLVSDCLDRRTPPWTYRVNRLLGARRIEPREQDEISRLPAPVRDAWLDEREATRPDPRPMPAMLGPADLAACDSSIVTWGSHTRGHSFLDRVSQEVARGELVDAKRRIEEVAGVPVRFLAYPNGLHSTAVQELAREAGYEAAFAVSQRDLTHGAPLFALPRIDLGCVSPGMLPLEAAGVVEMMRRTLR